MKEVIQSFDDPNVRWELVKNHSNKKQKYHIRARSKNHKVLVFSETYHNSEDALRTLNMLRCSREPSFMSKIRYKFGRK